MPIRDYTCLKCEHKFEAITYNDHDKVSCEKCGCTELETHLSLFGGYTMAGDNSASVRPKQAGSFKKGRK